MDIRFYIDPDTGLPHIEAHGVDEAEAVDVVRKPVEEISGRGNSVIAIGQTRGGRWLRVIYSPDEDGNGIFVITAYDLPAKQLRALRRRLKRKPK